MIIPEDRKLDVAIGALFFAIDPLQNDRAGCAIEGIILPHFSQLIFWAYQVENFLMVRNLGFLYAEELYRVIEREMKDMTVKTFDLIHATARQRCEAALAVMKAQENLPVKDDRQMLLDLERE